MKSGEAHDLADPQLGAILGEMVNYTPGSHVLAVLAGALRAWLLARGEPVLPGSLIRTLVPMSVRVDGPARPFFEAGRALYYERQGQLEAARELVARHPFIRPCDYGHWGDGGVHLNLIWKKEDAPWSTEKLKAELQPLIYDLAVTRFRGSFSAEHGVGPHNQAFYDRYTPALVKEICATLKARLDPKGLLGTTRLEPGP